jgi:glucosamine-6-phosphate deaminase
MNRIDTMSNRVFDFEPQSWIPIRDKKVLEYCRTIKREDMENHPHPNPEYKVRVVPDPSSAVAGELFNWIARSHEEDKKTVIIFPNSWRNIYSAVAQTCNQFNISARNIHAFCMDEWADEDGNVAPISYGPSLGGAFLREFYMSFREDLRPPLEQMHVFTNENIDCYSDMIEDIGEGGADLVVSATGWVGHTAFIDPNSKAFQAETLEEFLTLGARRADNHRLTIIQNSLGGCFGGSGDLANTPCYSVTVGPRDIINARESLERHDLTFLGGYSSWERMISRLQIYGPVTKDLPASIYQLKKGTIYVSEAMAQPIEPLEFISY